MPCDTAASLPYLPAFMPARTPSMCCVRVMDSEIVFVRSNQIASIYRRPNPNSCCPETRVMALWRQGQQHLPSPVTAMRAALDVDDGHALHEGPHLLGSRWIACRHGQQAARCGQALRLGRWTSSPQWRMRLKPVGSTCCINRCTNGTPGTLVTHLPASLPTALPLRCPSADRRCAEIVAISTKSHQIRENDRASSQDRIGRAGSSIWSVRCAG